MGVKCRRRVRVLGPCRGANALGIMGLSARSDRRTTTNCLRGALSLMSWVRAVALDLDGTIATGDVVSAEVLRAVAGARASGLRVFLVTGRTVSALERGFPGLIAQFDAVVAENGCVLVGLDRQRSLAEPVNPVLADALEHHGIGLSRGEVLLATSAEHDAAVLREITDHGLDCVLLRNRGELMVLPSGVSKGSGLRAALELFGLSAHNAIAVGDAENDHAMFEIAEIAAAPANGVKSVREHADLVLDAANGPGVIALLHSPLMDGEQRITSARRRIRIGTFLDGSPTLIPSTCATVMIAGGSGRGKSYLAGVVAEQLLEAGYRMLIIDPEGEQSSLGDLPDVEVVGPATGADAAYVAQRLRRGHNVVLDLTGVGTSIRTELFGELAALVAKLRAELGFPHWIVVDEAHALAGADGPLRRLYDPTAGGHLFVSYHPEQLCPEVLSGVDMVLSVTPPIDQLIDTDNLPASSLPRAATGQALLLESDGLGNAIPFTIAQRITSHRRHQRKYAYVLLPVGKGFRFRDSHQQLPEALSIEQFRAQLRQVDPDTLGWHMRRGDVSRWLAEVVQDRDLATFAAQLERDLTHEQRLEVLRCRDALGVAIDEKYLASGERVPGMTAASR